MNIIDILYYSMGKEESQGFRKTAEFLLISIEINGNQWYTITDSYPEKTIIIFIIEKRCEK